MSKKMILSGLVGAAVTAGAGFAAWVGSPVFDLDDQVSLPATLELDYMSHIETVADFNQDGFDDLVVNTYLAGGPDNTYEVLLNQSGTGYNSVWSFSGSPQELLAADVNGDGYPDLVLGIPGSDHVYAFINQMALLAACPTDLNKSGDTEVNDLLFVLERWGVCGEG